MAETASTADGASQRGAEGHVPCRLFLPVVPAARVIGKGGASIKAIREQSGAAVRILQKELPQEMQRREDRVAVISGEPEAMQEALALVLERVFDRSGLPDSVKAGSRDRAHIVEVLVPERSSSHIVGQRGERIRALIEETGCDIHVVKEPTVGLADQKRVRVTGNSADEVGGAVWRLHEVLEELVHGGVLQTKHFELREGSERAGSQLGGYQGAQGYTSPGAQGYSSPAPTPGGREVPVRLLVVQDAAAWIVGKRGNKITKLRDLAKVQMNDADSPPFDASDRIVEISAAPLEYRVKAVKMLLEDLALRQEPLGDLRLLVPTELFGSVMGHRGETIRGIMSSTGARLQQHKAERAEDGSEHRFRLVEVEGDIPQCVEVVRLLHQEIEHRQGPSGRAFASQPTSPAASASPWPAGDLAQGRRSGSAASLGLGLGAAAGHREAPLAVGGELSRAFASGASGGGSELSLQLAMPSEEVAKLLASESSGIAWRAGVKLRVGRGAGGIPILEVLGTAVGNSVACYLIQDRLFMMH